MKSYKNNTKSKSIITQHVSLCAGCSILIITHSVRK